jgi:hypothetical protein
MLMTALKPYRYSGKNLKPGDQFMASRRDARLLKALRVATDTALVPAPVVVREDPPPVVPDSARLAVLLASPAAEPAPDESVEPEPEPAPVELEPAPAEPVDDPADELLAEPRPKRTYKRRDLTAEE